MKFLQFVDRSEVQGIAYAKDQIVRFTDEELASDLILAGTASEIAFEHGGFVDHEINVGRLPKE